MVMRVRKIKSLDRKEMNAAIAALFLFQYSLVIPLRAFLPIVLLVAGSSIIIVLASLMANVRRSLNMGPAFVFVFVLMILMAKGAMAGNLSHIPLFFAIAGAPMFIFMNEFDEDAFLRFSSVLAVINFLAILVGIPRPGNDYMRFGYGIILTVSALYVKLFCLGRQLIRKNLIYMMVFLISFLELMIYGARGAILCFVIFFFLNRVLVQKEQVILNFLIIAAVAFVILNLSRFLDLAEMLVGLAGINSRPINKMRMLVEGGFAYASAGRSQIYASTIEVIKEHFIFGEIIDASNDDPYAHNLFLQVLRDLGIVGFIPLITMLVVIVAYIANGHHDRKKRMVLLLLFSIGVGRLLFSSTLWRRPEFWMMLYYWAAQVERKWKLSLGGGSRIHGVGGLPYSETMGM